MFSLLLVLLLYTSRKHKTQHVHMSITIIITMGGVREHVMKSVTSFTVQNGYSPLFVASQNGHADVVDLLVKAGADVHLATTKVFAYILCGLQSRGGDSIYLKSGGLKS